MKRVWSRTGLQAIEQASLGREFDVDEPCDPFDVDGRAAIVRVRTPLAYVAGEAKWTTYDALVSRVGAAAENKVTDVIVLDISSPGGDVAGVFEAAREIRALAAASGKRLVAYTEGVLASAAYAIACAASTIFVTPAATIGSVGVINALIDTTALDKAMGLRFEVIGSGDRKTDTNPHVALTDDAIAAMRGQIDALADVFFAWVGESRGGALTAEKVRTYQAGVFVGEEAKARGLADVVVTTKKQMLAMVTSQPTASAAENQERATMADEKYGDKMRTQLKADAQSDDQEKATAAKRMLAALDDEKSDDGEKKKDEKPASKADGDGDGDGDADAKKAKAEEEKKKDDEAKARAGSSDAIAKLAAENAALSARLDARDRADESKDRAAFYATRKDLPEATLKAFDSMPLAQAKAAISAIPVQKIVAPAAVTASGAQGKKSDDDRANVADLDPAEIERIDRAMGISKANDGIVRTENALILGNMSKAQARAHLEKLEKEGN